MKVTRGGIYKNPAPFFMLSLLAPVITPDNESGPESWLSEKSIDRKHVKVVKRNERSFLARGYDP
jgi:hypothetical protein